MKERKRKTVLVSGHFNVLHPGHLRLLRYAKECGDWLIVAVESDRLSGAAAHVPEKLRLEGVLSNSYVDEAFLTDRPVVEVIESLRPDLVIKGKEHEQMDNPEAEAVENYGGKLLFSSGETLFSSLDLIRREFLELRPAAIELPRDYIDRNNISKQRLLQMCSSVQALKVVVIGDLIIDEYITCQPLGMSQEDATIVVTPIDSCRFVGGAGIVAAHAAGLGAQVDFISVSGTDSTREFAVNKLKEFRVNVQLLEDSNRPTTLKQRYRCNGKSLLRVSHLHQGEISTKLQQQLLELLEEMLMDADLLVFSDFNYGALPQPLVDEITKLAKSNQVLIAADSQSSSQLGDISRFRGMDLITPTEYEARTATRSREDGLVILAEKLRKQAQAKNVLLKLGGEGLLIHAIEKSYADGVVTEQLPALNSHPKDVAGAGDSLLITSALFMASGASVLEAGLMGSLAAGVQVGRVGNNPLQIANLISLLK